MGFAVLAEILAAGSLVGALWRLAIMIVALSYVEHARDIHRGRAIEPVPCARIVRR